MQKTCDELRRQKFTDIRMFEVLVKDFENCEENQLVPNFGDAEAEAEQKEGEAQAAAAAAAVEQDGGEGAEEASAKRRKVADGSSSTSISSSRTVNSHLRRNLPPLDTAGKKLYARPFQLMRGHTGYLTFATKPASITDAAAAEVV